MKPLERIAVVSWVCPAETRRRFTVGHDTMWVGPSGEEVPTPDDIGRTVWLAAPAVPASEGGQVLVRMVRPKDEMARYAVCRRCWGLSDAALEAKSLVKRLR